MCSGVPSAASWKPTLGQGAPTPLPRRTEDRGRGPATARFQPTQAVTPSPASLKEGAAPQPRQPSCFWAQGTQKRRWSRPHRTCPPAEAAWSEATALSVQARPWRGQLERDTASPPPATINISTVRWPSLSHQKFLPEGHPGVVWPQWSGSGCSQTTTPPPGPSWQLAANGQGACVSARVHSTHRPATRLVQKLLDRKISPFPSQQL